MRSRLSMCQIYQMLARSPMEISHEYFHSARQKAVTASYPCRPYGVARQKSRFPYRYSCMSLMGSLPTNSRHAQEKAVLTELWLTPISSSPSLIMCALEARLTWWTLANNDTDSKYEWSPAMIW